jgi:hypothetical protein
LTLAVGTRMHHLMEMRMRVLELFGYALNIALVVPYQ